MITILVVSNRRQTKPGIYNYITSLITFLACGNSEKNTHKETYSLWICFVFLFYILKRHKMKNQLLSFNESRISQPFHFQFWKMILCSINLLSEESWSNTLLLSITISFLLLSVGCYIHEHIPVTVTFLFMSVVL